MPKSKLAIASFILSLMPTIIPILFILKALTIGRPEGATISIERLFSVGGMILVLAIAGLSFLYIISIILGVIALVKIRTNQLEGKWFAIAGIFISIGVLMFGLIIYFIRRG